MESYQRLIDVIALQNLQMEAEHRLLTQVLVTSTLWQVAIIALAWAAAVLAARPVHAWVSAHQPAGGAGRALKLALLGVMAASAAPVVALGLIGLAILAAGLVNGRTGLLEPVAQLIAAWIAIRFMAGFLRRDSLARAATALVFAVAALSILGLLEPAIVRLDRIGFDLGASRLSLLDLLRGVVELTVLIAIALALSRMLEGRVRNAAGMAPSLRVLISKLLRFALIAVALVIAMRSVGVDITAFALFTGALGVALGFGMQKSVSNLISGMLLLFDRSIKPGDVLELSDPNNRSVQLFGWVTSLNARYVSLTTRDGTEWLVPNDELISQRIVNWSYTHNRLRLLTPISISFDCDVKAAMRIAVEAANENPRVLADPPAVCRLMSFGDSCVNLEMRFWIEDPTNGIINVRSDVLVAVWERFRENGIRTALGHRDLFLKEGSSVSVRMAGMGE